MTQRTAEYKTKRTEEQPPNENCLEGMRCPKCGQADKFCIQVATYMEVTDDGTDTCGDVEWDDDSPASCSDSDCGWCGQVKDLRAAGDDRGPTRGFRVESIWTMNGIHFIEAHSPEEAATIAENGSLPAEQEYQGDSFEVIDVQGVAKREWAGEGAP